MGRGVILSKNKMQPSSAPYYLIPSNPKYPFTITGGSYRVHSWDYGLGGWYIWYNTPQDDDASGWSNFVTTIDIKGHTKATLSFSSGSGYCSNSGGNGFQITFNIGGRSTVTTYSGGAGWEQPESWYSGSRSITLDLTGLSGKVSCSIYCRSWGHFAGYASCGISSLYIE